MTNEKNIHSLNKLTRALAVRRITVDERLDANLIRILISDLCDDVEYGELAPRRGLWRTFTKELEDDTIWEDEESLLIFNLRINDIERTSKSVVDWSILLSNWEIPKRIWPRWEDLAEGQVYLEGAYTLRKIDDSIKLLRAPKRRHMVRVDLVPQVKDYRDRIYNRIFLRRARLA